MIQISYASMITAISVIWILIRAIIGLKNKHFDWKRELQLILVYICIVVEKGIVSLSFYIFQHFQDCSILQMHIR